MLQQRRRFRRASAGQRTSSADAPAAELPTGRRWRHVCARICPFTVSAAALDGEGGDVISCVLNRTFSRRVTHFLLMAQLDFSSEIQSAVGVMENTLIYECAALSEGCLSEETHQHLR